MTTTELLTRLADRHVILCPAGPDRLRFYPSSAVDSQLREALRKLKPDILRLVPPGWPEDVPIPSWWPELAGAFPAGFLKRAKPVECLDPECRFPVAVLWWDETDRRNVWSCPSCGLETGCRPIPRSDICLHEED